MHRLIEELFLDRLDRLDFGNVCASGEKNREVSERRLVSASSTLSRFLFRLQLGEAAN
jgi:hypothetical protein